MESWVLASRAPNSIFGPQSEAMGLAVWARFMKITRMPVLDGLRVVSSMIHGYGVVTTRPFHKGEVVCFGDGVLYSADDDFDDTYALILPGEDSADGDPLFWDLVCQTRWINHSCDPNSDVHLKWDRETKAMVAWWVAERDIPVGEEITYDYAFNAEVAEACACGAVTCRGLIVDGAPENLAQLPEHLRALLRAPTRVAS